MSRLSSISLALSVAALAAVTWVGVLARGIRADLDQLSQNSGRPGASAAAKSPELPADLMAELKRLRAEAADLRKSLSAVGTGASGEALTVADVKRVIEEFQAREARERRAKEWEARKPELRQNANKWLAGASRELGLDEAQARQVAEIRQEHVDRYVKLMVEPDTELVENPVTHERHARFVDDMENLGREMDDRIRAVLKPEQLGKFDSVPKFSPH
ncbi:MAG: hypothetical protein K8T20_08530 [Planctomycetes bacterium]|nr:hypothetical protein [Planctomycetota bacterium]